MRLDMITAECVVHLQRRGYQVCSPLDVIWQRETCSIAVYKLSQYTGKPIKREYVTVYRNEQGNIKLLFNAVPKELEFLVSDGIVHNGGIARR